MSEVRLLTLDQARSGRRVFLKGVVTSRSGWNDSFFLQDETAGISIDRLDHGAPLHQGQLVEVTGVTDGGLFAPVVRSESIRVRGEAPLPPATIRTPIDLTDGQLDSQWVALRGIVRSAEVKPVWGQPRLVVAIDIGGTIVSAIVQEFDAAEAPRLVAATVAVRGVCGTIFNGRRQFVGTRLFVASLRDVAVERQPPAEPFALPERKLGTLLQFRRDLSETGLVKVSGVTTWSKPGQGLYLQDGGQGMYVASGVEQTVPVGTRVEAVGYPTPGLYSPRLENAIFQPVGKASPIPPVEGSAASMIQVKDGFSFAPYDSLLVTVQGRLLEYIPGKDKDELLLQDGETVFAAQLPTPARNRLSLDEGTILRLTGVCAATADQAHEARSFSLLLRSKFDVFVTQPAPWWTVTHATWTLGLLLAAVFAMFGWTAFSRRQAQLQSLIMTDPLTGLYNRRGFLLFAQRQWRLTQQSGLNALLFYIDLDHFKHINDTLGHQYGDHILKSLADILRDSFRREDVIARLGGDEFTIFAAGSGNPSPNSLEARLRAAVHRFNLLEKPASPLALSIGVLPCLGETSDTDIEHLLSQADILMYAQKRQRRSAPTPSGRPSAATLVPANASDQDLRAGVS